MNYTNDDNMTYDLTKHRYILEDYSLENELGINLNSILTEAGEDIDDNDSLQWRNRLSRVFYTYLYSYSQSRPQSEYFLSLALNRSAIYEGMLMLAEAWVINRNDPGTVFGSTSYMTQELIDFTRGTGIATRSLFNFNDLDWADGRGVDY